MTPLSVALHLGRIGDKAFMEMRPSPIPVQLQRANVRITLLESENRALSEQLAKAITEVEWFKQRRRKYPAHITIEEIIEVVAVFYETSPMILYGRGQIDLEVKPRQVCCYVIKEITDRYSLPQIGRALGGRDHSTVHHAIKRIARERKTDAKLNSEIVQIIFELDRRVKLQPNAETGNGKALGAAGDSLCTDAAE